MSEILLHPEESFGDYIIEEELGQGGEGTVYQARKKKTDEKVSLKISKKPVKKTKAQIAEKTKPVTDLSDKLDHPGIIKIQKAGIFKKRPFLELESFKGKSLDKILRGYKDIQFGDQEKYLPTEQAIDIIIQISEALGYAHKKDIKHGDIKPANILINPENQIKLIDFGLDQLESTDLRNSLSVSGEIVGSMGYMSPQRQEGKPANIQDDIFSLGAVFYQLLTNQLPKDNNFQINPSEINPELPIKIDKIYRKMIAANPQDRYQSTRSIVTELEKCKKELHYPTLREDSILLLKNNAEKYTKESILSVGEYINKRLIETKKLIEATRESGEYIRLQSNSNDYFLHWYFLKESILIRVNNQSLSRYLGIEIGDFIEKYEIETIQKPRNFLGMNLGTKIIKNKIPIIESIRPSCSYRWDKISSQRDRKFFESLTEEFKLYPGRVTEVITILKKIPETISEKLKEKYHDQVEHIKQIID